MRAMLHLRGALVIPDRYFLTVMQRLVGASKDVRAGRCRVIRDITVQR